MSEERIVALLNELCVKGIVVKAPSSERYVYSSKMLLKLKTNLERYGTDEAALMISIIQSLAEFYEREPLSKQDLAQRASILAGWLHGQSLK